MGAHTDDIRGEIQILRSFALQSKKFYIKTWFERLSEQQRREILRRAFPEKHKKTPGFAEQQRMIGELVARPRIVFAASAVPVEQTLLQDPLAIYPPQTRRGMIVRMNRIGADDNPMNYIQTLLSELPRGAGQFLGDEDETFGDQCDRATNIAYKILTAQGDTRQKIIAEMKEASATVGRNFSRNDLGLPNVYTRILIAPVATAFFGENSFDPKKTTVPGRQVYEAEDLAVKNFFGEDSDECRIWQGYQQLAMQPDGESRRKVLLAALEGGSKDAFDNAFALDMHELATAQWLSECLVRARAENRQEHVPVLESMIESQRQKLTFAALQENGAFENLIRPRENVAPARQAAIIPLIKRAL